MDALHKRRDKRPALSSCGGNALSFRTCGALPLRRRTGSILKKLADVAGLAVSTRRETGKSGLVRTVVDHG
jgi:hypothetical protein